MLLASTSVLPGQYEAWKGSGLPRLGVPKACQQMASTEASCLPKMHVELHAGCNVEQLLYPTTGIVLQAGVDQLVRYASLTSPL